MVRMKVCICILLLILLLLVLLPSCAGAVMIKAISAGDGSMVLMDDGTVYAWGNNASHYLPEKVPGLSNITAISAYSANYMALSGDGNVWIWTWLDNQDSSPDLVEVPISNVTAISVPTMLKADGSVWEIVPSNEHDIFIYDVKNANVRQVPGLSNVTSIGRDVALKDDGSIWTWLNISQGYSLVGEFDPVIPVKVDISNVKQVVVSDSTTLALKNDGTVWAWGNNGFGMFGGDAPVNWSSEATLTPIQVAGLSSITSVTIHVTDAWALKDDGTVWMWGGDPYTLNGAESYSTPFKFSKLDNIVAISMGQGHAMALKKDGTLWAWGANFDGQLGDGKVKPPLDHSGGKDTPVKVLIDTSGLSSIYVSPTVTIISSPSPGNAFTSPTSSGNSSSIVVSTTGAGDDSSDSGLPFGQNMSLIVTGLVLIIVILGGIFLLLKKK